MAGRCEISMMSEAGKPTLVLVAVAALVGGAAGAGASWALTPKAEPKRVSTKATVEEALEADDSVLDERIARLEGQLHALRKRNTSSEALRQYARALNKGPASGDADGAGSDGDDGAPGDGLAPVVDAEDPSFELAVRTVLDRVDWEREEERRVTRSKRREERAKRQTELLTERLALSGAQQQKMEQILTDQMETFRSLREDGSDQPRPATRSEWRARVEAIRSETERKLGQVLDDEQMNSYRKFVEEEGFGPGRGRRRGGGSEVGQRSAAQQ